MIDLISDILISWFWWSAALVAVYLIASNIYYHFRPRGLPAAKPRKLGYESPYSSDSIRYGIDPLNEPTYISAGNRWYQVATPKAAKFVHIMETGGYICSYQFERPANVKIHQPGEEFIFKPEEPRSLVESEKDPDAKWLLDASHPDSEIVRKYQPERYERYLQEKDQIPLVLKVDPEEHPAWADHEEDVPW